MKAKELVQLRRSLAVELTKAVAKDDLVGLSKEQLMLAAAAYLRSTDDEPGFTCDCQPDEEDCEQLLETGWLPTSFTRYDLCPVCDGVMPIGDEFPEERCCMVCVNDEA